MTERLCDTLGCARPHYGRGLCQMHYMRQRRLGLLAPLPRKTPTERFWAKIDEDGPAGCWLWRGTFESRGYGQIVVDGRMVMAHRMSYELLRGPIPPGLDLDHLCRVRACVNPDHLEPVTRSENIRRGLLSGLKIRCPQGHLLAETRYMDACGRNRCRVCRRDQERRNAAKQRLRLSSHGAAPAA